MAFRAIAFLLQTHMKSYIFPSKKARRNAPVYYPSASRPWLQTFRNYAFDKRGFHGDEIRSQIRAAKAFVSHDWMLWNPCNIYSRDGLKD